MIRLLLLSALLLAGGDVEAEVIRHAWVPNRWFPQGETRLLADEGTVRIEVVLHSAHMDRVVNAIVSKEQKNWPAHHPDATRYVELLKQAREMVSGEGKEVLVILFEAGEEQGAVRFQHAAVTESKGIPSLKVAQRRNLLSFVPTDAYLVRNMRLIMEDSLDYSRAEAREVLSARLASRWIQHIHSSHER